MLGLWMEQTLHRKDAHHAVSQLSLFKKQNHLHIFILNSLSRYVMCTDQILVQTVRSENTNKLTK